MNIGLLIESSAWGGAEIHAVGLTRALLQRGHEAALVAVTEQAYEICHKRVAAEIPLACLASPKPSNDMGYLDWRRMFAKWPWDVCMLIKGDIDSGGGWAIDFAARRQFGGYLVLEQKDVDPLGPKTSRRHFGFLPGMGLWWHLAHLRRYLRSLGPHKIVCVTEANRRRLVEDHGYSERKMVAIHNGIDVQRFRCDLTQRKLWRTRWGLSDTALVFGAVGRLHRIKGYDVALEAFQILLNRFPNREMQLILVGEGPEEQALRARSERLDPRSRVIFLPFDEHPETLLSAFDVFVMPSISEGLPLALAEAMACECCPIATDVGGIAEAVSGSDFGWLVPAGSVGAFAEAMTDAACRTTDELASMGRRAREQAVEHFNAAVQYEALTREIESLGTPRPIAPVGSKTLKKGGL